MENATLSAEALEGWAKAVLLALALVFAVVFVWKAPARLSMAAFLVFGPMVAVGHEELRDPTAQVSAALETWVDDLTSGLDQ